VSGSDLIKLVAGVRNQLILLFNIIDTQKHKNINYYNTFTDRTPPYASQKAKPKTGESKDKTNKWRKVLI